MVKSEKNKLIFVLLFTLWFLIICNQYVPPGLDLGDIDYYRKVIK